MPICRPGSHGSFPASHSLASWRGYGLACRRPDGASAGSISSRSKIGIIRIQLPPSSPSPRLWFSPSIPSVTALGLELTVELTESGVIRTREALENLVDEPYRLDELLVCLPVPLIASEVLDFAGRWGRERAPSTSSAA